jgi:hypothetical protein
MALDEAETSSIDEGRPPEEEGSVNLVVESTTSLTVADAVVVDADDDTSPVFDE